MASMTTGFCVSRVTSVPACRMAPRNVVVRADSEDVYIGKGKYVKDDPDKYPTRTQLTGGWAGGEAGLAKFLEDSVDNVADTRSGTGPSTKLLGGKDIIYTGKGNYARDDLKKYPERSSTTGGFAGGERGVSQFVQEGDLKFSEKGDEVPQRSPLFIALAMASFAVIVTLVWLKVDPSAIKELP